MHDDEAFLSAITEHPDDDLPRLVYADYLDERGDHARAEFIRVQIELARLDTDDPRRPALERRENELHAEHSHRWLGPWSDFTLEWTYRRGFIEKVGLEAGAFLHHAGALLRATPVRRLALWNAWEEIDKLAKCHHLARIRELSLSSNFLGDDEVRRLVESPYLENVESLDLSHNRFSFSGVQALADSRHLLAVGTLDLSANDVGSVGAAALADSLWFGSVLHELSLAATGLGPEGVELLAFHQGLGLLSLTTLDLSHNAIGRRGVLALVHGPSAGRWQRVYLRGMPLTPEQRDDLLRRFGEGGVVFD